MALRTVLGGIQKDILTGIALIIGAFLLSVYIPLFGLFCSLFFPLPVLFYRIKLGRKPALMIPAAAVFIVALMSGSFSVDLLIFSEIMLLGFILAELYERNMAIEKTLVYACVATIGSGVISLAVIANLGGSSLFEFVSGYVARNLELSLVLYREMGIPEENIAAIGKVLESIEFYFIRVLPGLTIAATLLMAWSSTLIVRPFLVARGLFFPPFGALNRWRCPESLVWGVIGCGLLVMMPVSAAKVIALNGLLVLGLVFFFQGLAICSYFFQKRKFSRAARFFLYSLIALQHLVLLFVIGLGFFDVWINFRKIETPQNK